MSDLCGPASAVSDKRRRRAACLAAWRWTNLSMPRMAHAKRLSYLEPLALNILRYPSPARERALAQPLDPTCSLRNDTRACVSSFSHTPCLLLLRRVTCHKWSHFTVHRPVVYALTALARKNGGRSRRMRTWKSFACLRQLSSADGLQHPAKANPIYHV